ncbi:MAG: hypothetical protein RLZ98_708 [Pseudomonadota bacterium]|jgi:zinc transport system permease protein
MIEDFVFRALIAGVGVALVAGPLGAFIVWRRMAYFGATLSHGALLGVALGLMANVAPMLGVLVMGVAMVPALRWLEHRATLPTDTLLGLLAHGMLALGLVLIAFLPGIRVDLMGYLFGDVLAVTWTDIAAVWLGGAVILAVLLHQWRALLAGTVSADIAAAEGLAPERTSTVFMLLTAVVIAIAMKVVGVLLILSLLIIPAATARGLSRSPEEMAAYATVAGAASVVLGLAGAMALDTPAGPSIVVAALGLFLVSLAVTASNIGRWHAHGSTSHERQR